MSVPKELMDLVGGAGGPPGAGGGAPAPGGGPMSTPNPMEGLQMEAMVNMTLVMDVLAKSIPAFGPTTKEGKAVLNALKTLTNAFGKDRQAAGEFAPAQLTNLLQSVPNPAGKPMNAMSPAQPAVPQGAPA